MSTGGNTLLEQIVYLPFGPVSSWVWGNGGSYGRSYDPDGRVSAISIVGTTQVPGTRTITPDYDTASRITQIADTSETAKDYGYDTLDRLISYSATPTTHSYSYDANGNRLNLTTDGGSSAYTYATTPASNRLLSVSGLVTRTNTQDTNGSLTADGVNSYTYDARGRMAGVTTGGLTTSYGVNGLGQRVSKAGSGVQPSGAVVYTYDEAGHLIGEYDGVTGATEQETVWLGDLPVAVLTGDLTSPAVYNVHPDHLSAPKVITDQIGNVVWNWDHDPFGNGQPTGTLSYNLRFPGQYYDVETGLNYNMNRDYDPVLGRYVQSDPIGLEGGINTYGYVGQNPLSYTDPEGLQALPLVVNPVVLGGAAVLAGQAVIWLRQQHALSENTESLGGPMSIPDPTEMAKGGKQNLENEYSREARLQPDPCDWLKQQYDGARSAVERNKIKQAQKQFGCRGNSTTRDQCK